MKMKHLTQVITGSLALLSGLIILTPNAGADQAFVAGDIVVERLNIAGTVGNAQQVDVLEYDTSGALKQTISMPFASPRPTVDPFNLADGGSSSTDGGLTRSADGGMIALPGFNSISGDTSPAASASPATLRVIGAISLGGTKNTSRAINIFSTLALRGVASTDGTKFWCTGANGTAGSLWYYDSVNAPVQLPTTSANLRQARIFNNQLFVSSGAGNPGVGISSVAVLGNTLPTSGTATYTLLIATGTGAGTENFEFNSTMDVCYIADDRSTSSGGGIQKWTKSGGIWSLAYTISTGTTSGAFGLAVDWSGANPVIYATSSEAATAGNRVVKFTDTGSVGTAATLVGITANKWFRGVALAPVSSVAIGPTAAPAAGSLTVGATDVPVFGFQLTPIGTGTSASFTALKLTTAGTATSSDLSNFRLVYDVNSNGTYESGTDTVVSDSAQSLANPINFTITGQPSFTAAQRYLVIADVAGGATLGHSFTGSIAAAGDVTSTPAPQGTAAGNRQTVGIDMTMSAVVSSESATLSSLLNDATITTTSQGAQVWQVTFSIPTGAAGAATLSSITFSQGANNGVANWSTTIQAAELFDGSTALGAGTVSATGIAFSGLSVTVPEPGSKTLSLRISLKSTAGALTDNAKFQFALAASDVTASGNGVVTTDPIISDPAQNQIIVIGTRLAFTTQPTFVLVSGIFTATVQAQDANGNRDLDDSSTGVTVTTASGGTLGGGSVINLNAGLHTFASLTYDTAGNFILTASGGTLAPATSGTITAEAVATVTEVIMPQFVQGIASGSSNSKRLPFAFRATLGNLVANATYRYYNMCVVGTDTPTTDGAGNCIFVTPSGNFVRTSGTSMSTAGDYGTFTADNTGAYTGWFVLEPTGNATRFIAGDQILMRIMLNNGLGGTTVFQRVTTSTPVTVLAFDNTANPNTGTGIRGNSYAPAKNFVLLYDNTAGTGQPLTGTFVENDGAAEDASAGYVSFYNTSVDGISGAWGAIISNNNANGVQRIEQRALSDGSVVLASTASSGVWPSGANTVNPLGADANPIVITTSDAPLGVAPPTVPNITQIQVVGGSVLIDFTGGTSDTITSFTVLGTASLTTPLAPIAASFSTSGPGLFRATVTGATPPAFYRIRRP
jgi:hypothetical protein